jgi:hypothetical protein
MRNLLNDFTNSRVLRQYGIWANHNPEVSEFGSAQGELSMLWCSTTVLLAVPSGLQMRSNYFEACGTGCLHMGANLGMSLEARL